MECKGRPRACVHAAFLFARKLCAQTEVLCAKAPVLSVHLCICTACKVLRTACKFAHSAAKYILRTVCKVYVRRARQVFMVACLHNFALGRLTKIYILSATGYLLQPCCQLEMQPTLSLCLWSGTRYTIDYCHPLSSQTTQNSLFISHYYMLTSALSVSCPTPSSQEFEYLWTWSISKRAFLLFFSPLEV